ncbi:MAG: hypothetical protein N4A35_00030 [Flavobacteriales bacterium]|jgi:hypothetical protein|nr:hypothetical protein [Flavobacteriales bacterium]
MRKIIFLILFQLIVITTLLAQHQVNWHLLRNVSVDASTNIVTKTSTAAWDAGALSTNKLAANTDGKITYVVGGSEHYLMFGFAEYNEVATYTGFLHKFYLYGVATKYLDGYGAVTAGDTLILERIGSQVFRHIHHLNGNQVTLTAETTDPTKELFIDLSIRFANYSLNNMHCDFEDGLTIEQHLLHHQNTTNNTLGSIDVNVTGEAPLSYSWSNGGTVVATTQDISGLSAGTYTLTVTDGNSQTLSKSFIIHSEESYLVDWRNIQNLEENSTTGELTKNSSYQWDGGALSTNKLEANTNGKITYVYAGNESYLMFGFSEYNEVASYTSLDYKFYLYGVNNHFLDGYGNINIGDTLILERYGNQMIYRKHDINGVQHVLKEQTTDPTKELYVDVSIRFLNRQLNSLYSTFSQALTIEEHILKHENSSFNTLGSIDVNVTGPSPISYSWSNGATTQDLSGLTAGNYTLTVTDGTGETLVKTFTVEEEESYQVNWQHIENYTLAASTNVLTSNANTPTWQAGALSTNKLPANANGKLTYVVNGNEFYAMIGLSNYNTIAHFSSIDHQVFINGNKFDGYGRNLSPGDIIEVTRVGGEISYKKLSPNGKVDFIKTEAVDPNEELYVDVCTRYPNYEINNIYTTFYSPKNTLYYPLNTHLTGGYYELVEDALNFHYYERYTPSNGNLNYKIIDLNNSPVSVSLPVLPIVQGDNHLSIDFSSLGLANGYYLLKVTNEKNEVKQLRFKL